MSPQNSLYAGPRAELEKTCRFERVTVKSLGAGRSFMVQQNKFVARKAAGRAGNLSASGDPRSPHTKTVILQSNELVLEKVDTGGEPRPVGVYQKTLPVARHPETLEHPVLNVSPSKFVKAEKKQQALISLFEDDWKEDGDEESYDSPQQAADEELSGVEQKPVALNDSLVSTNYQLLKLSGKGSEGRNLFKSFRPNPVGPVLVKYGRFQSLKEETQLKVLVGENVSRPWMANSGSTTMKDILDSSTPVAHTPTISASMNKKTILTPVRATQSTSLAVKNSMTDVVDVVSAKIVGRKVPAGPGKRICTIRPYGCVQVSGEPSKESPATSVTIKSSEAFNAGATSKSIAGWSRDSRTGKSPDPVTTVAVPSKTMSSSDTSSFTYSSIQSLWDNSKFEDDDLVLQPFQLDSSSNNIVLGHISEGSMKE